MQRKYEIMYEAGWDDNTQSPKYEKLITVKNEQAAIDFATDLDNIGKYGDMTIRMKSNGNLLTYNERNGSWE